MSYMDDPLKHTPVLGVTLLYGVCSSSVLLINSVGVLSFLFTWFLLQACRQLQLARVRSARVGMNRGHYTASD